MKALRFPRAETRFAAALVAGRVRPGAGARVGPLELVHDDPPELPGPGWEVIRPRLAGICGSDLATVDGRSSRWFEPVVSFPFVPGHEVIADRGTGAGSRVLLEPVLGCAARAVDPPCPACAAGALGNCHRISFGALRPGLQSGYCADTGGGWATHMVAHESQLHPVPEDLSDEAAVMVEPTACGVHAALAAGVADGETVAVIGAGTLGLLAVAALRSHTHPHTLICAARYPEQARLAGELGADVVVDPDETARAVRRATGTLGVGDGPVRRLAGGADVVLDCVGSAATLQQALEVVRPRGTVVLVGMPGEVAVDLTPLWQREIRLVGAYAYGTETVAGRQVRTFDLAADLVRERDLGRLVSAGYPLDRYTEAVTHAAEAGRRGSVKIAFDLRDEKERNR